MHHLTVKCVGLNFQIAGDISLVSRVRAPSGKQLNWYNNITISAISFSQSYSQKQYFEMDLIRLLKPRYMRKP